MGDRCYMHVTCLRQDQSKFEDLGFHHEFEEAPHSPIIEMADDEANYAHTGKLPLVPFTAWHDAGGDYGAGRIVCDGKEMCEVPATQDGFVVVWDFKKQKPAPQSLKEIRHYLRVHQQVRHLFKTLARTSHQHLFSPHTQRCLYCNIHAEEDAVENQPCPQY